MKLILTNGDSAVMGIQQAGIDGELIPWCDALHDGPVPGGLSLPELSAIRATYVSDSGWGSCEEIEASFQSRDERLRHYHEYEEVILWFEHDLYDQLQMMQIMAWLAENGNPSAKLSCICERRYVGELDSSAIQQQFANRCPLDGATLLAAKNAWVAFCSDHPQTIAAYLHNGTDVYFFKEALRRFLQEYPSSFNGLRRTEQNALSLLQNHPIAMGQLFCQSQGLQDEPKYLGDDFFAGYMSKLSDVVHPLILFENDETVDFHPVHSTMENFWKRYVKLTEFGKQVLDGSKDHVHCNGINRWMGGVHLKVDHLYRYDASNHFVIKANKTTE